MNQAPIMWTTQKHTLVTLSSGESEYVAMSYCGKLVKWLLRLFWEVSTEMVLDDEPKMYPITMFSDSSTGLSIAKNPRVSERNKHIALKYQHIKELAETGIINIKRIRAYLQATDRFTKSLPVERLNIHTILCGIRNSIMHL